MMGGADSSGNFMLMSEINISKKKAIKASQLAKQLGCKSLKQITDKTGTSLQTLTNWHHHKPDLFYVVCVGVAALHNVES